MSQNNSDDQTKYFVFKVCAYNNSVFRHGSRYHLCFAKLKNVSKDFFNLKSKSKSDSTPENEGNNTNLNKNYYTLDDDIYIQNRIKTYAKLRNDLVKEYSNLQLHNQNECTNSVSENIKNGLNNVYSVNFQIYHLYYIKNAIQTYNNYNMQHNSKNVILFTDEFTRIFLKIKDFYDNPQLIYMNSILNNSEAKILFETMKSLIYFENNIIHNKLNSINENSIDSVLFNDFNEYLQKELVDNFKEQLNLNLIKNMLKIWNTIQRLALLWQI